MSEAFNFDSALQKAFVALDHDNAVEVGRRATSRYIESRKQWRLSNYPTSYLIDAPATITRERVVAELRRAILNMHNPLNSALGIHDLIWRTRYVLNRVPWSDAKADIEFWLERLETLVLP